jgi:Spy/CpxP family protein refolding chaperone
MNARFLRGMLVGLCLVVAAEAGVWAQGKAPAGAPPAGLPLGGYGSFGPQGGPGSLSAPAGSSSQSATGAVRSGLQLGPAGRWWDDKTVTRSIGLRKEQQRKMDAIFNANKPAIVESYKAFLSEQSKLEALGKEQQVDKAHLFAAIDAVSQARATLQKATAQMLLQIRQQMDTAQIVKLEKLQ